MVTFRLLGQYRARLRPWSRRYEGGLDRLTLGATVASAVI